MQVFSRTYLAAMITFFCSSFYFIGGLTPVKLAFAMLLVYTGYLIKKGYEKIHLANTSVLLAFTFFLIFSFSSLIYAKDKTLAIKNLNSLIYAYFLFVALIILIKYSTVNYKRIQYGLIVAGLVNCIFSFLQVLTGAWFMPGTPDRSTSTEGMTRANGLYDDPNYLGLFLVCLWPFLFQQEIRYRYLLLLIFVSTIFLTFSRATAIIFFIQVLIFVYLNTRNKLFFLLKSSAVIISLSGILLVFNPLGLADRFLSVGSVIQGDESSYDNSTAERLDVFFAGIKMFFDYPFFGVGYGNFQRFSSSYMDFFPREVLAHNTYITILAELGILGFLLFVFYLYSIGNVISKSKDSVLIVSFIGYLMSIYFLVAQAFPTAMIFLTLYVCSKRHNN